MRMNTRCSVQHSWELLRILIADSYDSLTFFNGCSSQNKSLNPSLIRSEFILMLSRSSSDASRTYCKIIGVFKPNLREYIIEYTKTLLSLSAHFSPVPAGNQLKRLTIESALLIERFFITLQRWIKYWILNRREVP